MPLRLLRLRRIAVEPQEPTEDMRMTLPRAVLAALMAPLIAGLLSACASLRSMDGEDSDTLAGSVTYRPRIALPPDATVHVRVQDVSRADAPAVTIAERTIATDGRQVPIPFALEVDRSGIEPGHRLVVRAEIRDRDGALRWTTDSVHEVPISGPLPEDVELVVVQTSAARTEPAALIGPTWRLLRIETADGRTVTPGAAETYTVTFDSAGRIAGQADCNRYGGSYRASPDGELALERLTSTLVACLPSSSADAYMRVLNAITAFDVTGDELRLVGRGAGSLVFRRSGDG